MEILGIGGFEIALVFIIALVVAGPARMAVWARTLGRWVAKMRQLWTITAAQLQRELDDAGVDFKVPKDIPTRQAIVQELSRSSTVAEFRKPIDEIRTALQEGETAAREAGDSLREVRTEVQSVAHFKPVRPIVPKPDPVPKPPEPDKPGFGTWGGDAAVSGPAAPPADSRAGFGTWGADKPDEEQP